jgi:hypothetical protein
MQQTGFYGNGVHSHVGQDVGNRHGMRHVGLAGSPKLILVKAVGEVERAVDLGDVVVGPVFLDGLA